MVIGDWKFTNDFRVGGKENGGHCYRLCLLDLYITECPGRPVCKAKHWHVGLVIANLGFLVTVEWRPKVLAHAN